MSYYVLLCAYIRVTRSYKDLWVAGTHLQEVTGAFGRPVSEDFSLGEAEHEGEAFRAEDDVPLQVRVANEEAAAWKKQDKTGSGTGFQNWFVQPNVDAFFSKTFSSLQTQNNSVNQTFFSHVVPFRDALSEMDSNSIQTHSHLISEVVPAYATMTSSY